MKLDQRHRIAISGFSPLYAAALAALIERDCDACVEICHTRAISTSDERYDLWLLSADAYVMHSHVLRSRRLRTAVVCADSAQSADWPTVISLQDSAEQMLSKLSSLLPDDGAEGDTMGELTPRERAVLAQIAAGRTNKEISEILYISVNTVLTHRKNLTRKLGIRSVSGLTLYAVMNGIATPIVPGR